MFPDPSTTRIIHDRMVVDALARRNPDHRLPGHDGPSRPRRASGIRRATARTLVRLADRIAPVPVHEPEPTAA